MPDDAISIAVEHCLWCQSEGMLPVEIIVRYALPSYRCPGWPSMVDAVRGVANAEEALRLRLEEQRKQLRLRLVA